jgi:hypothetical protein
VLPCRVHLVYVVGSVALEEGVIWVLPRIVSGLSCLRPCECNVQLPCQIVREAWRSFVVVAGTVPPGPEALHLQREHVSDGL